MAQVSVSLPSDGNTASVSDYNTPINTLLADYNGNIDNSNIASAAAISTSKLASDNWLAAWTSWTPTWTNLTTGNGTLNVAKYVQIGKTVHFRLKFTLGSTSAVGTVISVSLPVTAAALGYNADGEAMGFAVLRDASGSIYNGVVTHSSTTVAVIRYISSGIQSNLTATTPFTWTTSDYIQIDGSYEAA